MTTIKCENCLKDVQYSHRNFKKYNHELNFVLCTCCIQNNILYTKDFCKNNLYLTEKEISELKYLFNPNVNKKLYWEKYINNYFLNKYGTKEKLKIIINQKKQKKEVSKLKKDKVISERRQLLMKILYENKIDYNENGICYTYINYGFPNIDDLVKQLISESQNIIEKKINFIQLLKENNIEINENMNSYKQYINNNYSNVTEIIKKAKVEDFLIKNTNYLNYLSTMNYENAKDKAIQELSTNKIEDSPLNKIIVDFN